MMRKKIYWEIKVKFYWTKFWPKFEKFILDCCKQYELISYFYLHNMFVFLNITNFDHQLI